MKKISLMLVALAAILTFSACRESKDDHPVLYPNDEVQEAPFLNTPEMTNTAVMLTEQNAEGYIHMTCSQPDYGFAAPVKYEVEVSLNQDFSTPAVDGCPASVVLPTSFTDCAEINPVNGEIATAMEEMLGIVNKDQLPIDYHKLYMRLHSNILTAGGDYVAGTSYVSNIVSIEQVACDYLAIIVAGEGSGIYLVGSMSKVDDNGWQFIPKYEFLTTTEKGVYVIEDVNIAAGEEFKVADKSWSNPNCGGNGSAVEFNKAYALDNGSNPPNITMPADFKGRVTLTQKGNSYTIFFETAEPDTPGQPTGVYLRGDFNDWGATPESEFITTDIKNVWTVAAVTLTGGFKVADADWSSTNLGASSEDPIEIGSAYQLVSGGGNISIDGTFTGSATLKQSAGKYLLTLTPEGE